MKNIKLLFFGLLLLTSAIHGYGQSNRFDIGIEGGPSITSLRGNTLVESYQGVGFLGGVFFQFNLSERFSLRTNMAYERKGTEMSVTVTDVSANSLGEASLRYNFDYLTLPLLVKATFGKKVKFFVNAGPYLGYLLKQTYVIEGDHYPKTTNENTRLYKRFDSGLTTGIGCSIPIQTKFAISFEIRNNLGLYPINDASNADLKTNSTNFLFGFAYKL